MVDKQDTHAHWIDQGRNQKAVCVIVVYDAQTGSQFPVFVNKSEDLKRERQKYNSGYYAVATEYSI